MEKYLICSDIHGSELYFKKVYDYYKNNGYTKMIILGDLLYHGPRNDLPEGYRPKGIIPLVNEMKDEIIMVKGNCEAEVDQMVVSFHIYNRKKIFIFGKNVYLEHGHHLDKTKYHNGDIVFYGHTHVSKYENIGGVKFINPGSVSIPKENTEHSFLSLSENELKLISLNGNVLELWEF